MAILPFVHAGLKTFAAVWALVTFAVTAAEMSLLNSDFGSGEINNTNFAAGNAIIAAGVLAFLYFTAAVILIILTPKSFLISVIIDTSVLGFLFIFFLASAAAFSTEGHWFSYYSGFQEGSRGQGVLALAWIMTLLILGILLLEVIYTWIHFGRSWTTWRTPFNQLLTYGTPGAGIRSVAGQAETGGLQMSAVQPPATGAVATPAAGSAVPTETTTAQQTVTPYPHTAQPPVSTSTAEKVAQI